MTEFVFTALFLLMIEGYLRVAKEFRIYDVPNRRSSHRSRVIRGLGILFIPGLILSHFLFGGHNLWLLAGVLLGTITGFMDDLRESGPWIRMLLYMAAVGATLQGVGLFNSGVSSWTLILALVLTLGTVNAYNFMDGINGISVLYSLVSLGTVLGIVEMSDIAGLDLQLIISSILIIAAFGIFNVRKQAKAFLGDSGSISLGILCSYAVISLILYSGDPIYILLLSVYGVDAVGTILLRITRKENIFQAHRLHIYQKLANEKGYGHLRVAFGYAVLQLLINLILIDRIDHAWRDNLNWLIGILLVLTTLYILLRVTVIKDLPNRRHSHV